MANPIVVVDVSTIQAPIPSKLQRTGAFVTQGGTTLAAGTYGLLTSLADLADIIKSPLANSTLTWSGGVVTVTTAAAHGIANATTFQVTIAGVTPSGYNTTALATVTGASTFTYPLGGNPGSETVPGTWVPASASSVQAMATTFFAQGSSTAVYVLELGLGAQSDGVAALATWITNNPDFFYSYLIPRNWDSNSDFLTFLAGFENTTSKTYFFITTTTITYSNYTPSMKCALTLIMAPAAPTTEFTMAAMFYVTLKWNPSTTNKVPPLCFSYVYGVTAYPVSGNGTFLTTIAALGINYVAVGAEGGISNTMLYPGQTMDVRPFNYWYSIDWAQINLKLDIANAIINGSNNSINPLYYNQNGIDRLQSVSASTLSRGITYGLILGRVTQVTLDGPEFGQNLDDGDYAGQAVVNAIPFIPYNVENPSDYRTGTYNGLSAVITPLRGFQHILFNLVVTDFVAQ